jgi:hypothetical protein
MSSSVDPDDTPSGEYEVVADVPGGRRITVQFCAHARARMRQRRITDDQVITALRLPDRRGLPADPPKLRVCRVDGDNPSRELHVVYLPNGKDRFVVISTFWQ